MRREHLVRIVVVGLVTLGAAFTGVGPASADFGDDYYVFRPSEGDGSPGSIRVSTKSVGVVPASASTLGVHALVRFGDGVEVCSTGEEPFMVAHAPESWKPTQDEKVDADCDENSWILDLPAGSAAQSLVGSKVGVFASAELTDNPPPFVQIVATFWVGGRELGSKTSKVATPTAYLGASGPTEVLRRENDKEPVPTTGVVLTQSLTDDGIAFSVLARSIASTTGTPTVVFYRPPVGGKLNCDSLVIEDERSGQQLMSQEKFCSDKTGLLLTYVGRASDIAVTGSVSYAKPPEAEAGYARVYDSNTGVTMLTNWLAGEQPSIVSVATIDPTPTADTVDAENESGPSGAPWIGIGVLIVGALGASFWFVRRRDR